MAYVGSLDQGTTSTRFLIFDETFTPVAGHQVEHKQYTPQPGWLEHDADEILANCWLCIDKAVAALKAKKGAGATVKAMGITNQRETTVAWSAATGKPLCKAIVWSDARTAETVQKVVATAGGGNADFARAVCGLPASTYFSAMKMRWMLDNVPAVASAHDSGDLRFGTIDSWLVYSLSNGRPGAGAAARRNVHVTDVTNASRTMLMSLATRAWDANLCAKFGIKAATLPKIVSCSELLTDIHVDGVSIPVCGCIGDQQGAIVGQRCFAAGMAKNTFGTGCFLLTNTGTAVPPPSKSGLLVTVCYQLGPNAPTHYALEGAVAGAGSTVQWLRDKMGFFADAADSEKLAASVPDAGGVVFVPAFGGLLAPHWRPDARGTIVGMTQHTTKAHLVRATLDAVAQQVTQLVRAMEKDSGVACTELRVDGGMTRNKLLMQLQADSLGKPVRVPAMPETTALGAAICASLVGGVWGDVVGGRGGAAQQAAFATVAPRTTEAQRAALQARWDEAVQRSFGWDKL